MGIRSGGKQMGRTVPQSIRHQRILDIAGEQPQASMESIAEQVPSATVELVEHVLEEYGDPADDIAVEENVDENIEENVEETAGSDHVQQSVGENSVKIDETDDEQFPIGNLNDGQREVLRVVAERPEATQQEIGERLGLSAPTVCNRVAAIDGFDWQHRQQAVQDFRAQDSTDKTRMHETMATNETEPTSDMDRLDERIDVLEQRVASTPAATGSNVDIAPELLQKVVHACFKSEAISEDEELELLKTFLPNDG